MKLLAIGDIHGEDIWKYFGDIRELLDGSNKSPEYYKYVFLGDYVDSFKKTNVQIMENLKLILSFKYKFPNHVILLIGNHDLGYWFSSPNDRTNPYSCSGYRPEMHFDLYELYGQNKEYFQCAYQVDNYLFTHAGISNKWFNYVYKTGLGNYSNYAELIEEEVRLKNPAIFAVGYIRWGSYPAGGPFWADKSETSSGYLSGIHQVVGHTHVKEITRISSNGLTGSITYCDVLQSEYPEPLILEI